MIDDKKLISQLLASDLIDQSRLRKGLEIAEQNGVSLYDVVIRKQLVEEHEVVEIASEMLNVPCVHLDKKDLNRRTARLIPADLAISIKALPLEIVDDGDVRVLKLAMLDPIDVMAMDEIADHIEVDIRPVLVGPSALERAIEKLYGDDEDDESIFELTETVSDSGEAFELDDDDDAIELSDSIPGQDEFELDDGPGIDFDSGDFEVDDDDAIELDDSAIEEIGVDDDEIDFSSDSLGADDGAQNGSSSSSEIVDAPQGLVEDEDSWAAMFDEVEESEASQQQVSSGPRPPLEDDDSNDAPPDSGPVSQEMRDRPPTGVLEVVEDDLEDDEDPTNRGPAFSQHPASFDNGDSTTGTQVGSPAELGDWELDEALEKSGAARLKKNRDQQEDTDDAPTSSPGTQVGSPVDPDQWDLDDGVYDEDEKPEIADSTDIDNDQTQIGVGTRGAIAGLDLEDDSDDASSDDSSSTTTTDNPSDTNSGMPADDESNAGGDEKSGPEKEDGGAKGDETTGDEVTDEEATGDEPSVEDDDDDKKSKVPKSLRSALDKASSKKSSKKESSKDNSGPSLPPPPKPKSKRSDSDGDDKNDTKDESKPALGRIEVKKKRVPKSTFKGVVEKRSDRQPDNDPSTREMSSSDLSNLTAKANSGSSSLDVELPDDVDTRQLLCELLELLVDQDVLSADQLQALIENIS